VIDMSGAPINITLGTAGHIDHGKTLLIKCLTGCETDRLREEKERGMSIELGFAPCTLGELAVGIVDVPGHEHFVKTMVAGASGMDGVILVVAADDGVMPQTREHLDILTLLGIEHGVIALTKIDRVEPELVELAREDVRALVRGTFLEGAPILPVSSVNGEGFGALYEALVDLVGRIRPKPVDGVFRLPVERAFSVKGYGTVVSGIPVAGSLGTDDEVVLLPQDLAGRIKAIQVYGRESPVVQAGQCAALNMRHWDHRVVHRGDVIAVPGYFTATSWCVCRVRLLEHERAWVKNGAQVRFHSGTSERTASLYLLAGQQLRPGEESLVQLHLNEPVVVGPADRFILRSLSPVVTVGGGIVVEATQRRANRNHPGVREDLQVRSDAVTNVSRFVEYCLRSLGTSMVDETALARRAKVTPSRLAAILSDLVAAGRAIRLPNGLVLHEAGLRGATSCLTEALERFHGADPQRLGMPIEEVAQTVGLDREVLKGLVARLREKGQVVERNERLALPGRGEQLSEEDQQLFEAVEAVFRHRGFSPPTAHDLAKELGVSQLRAEQGIRFLVEHERLIRVDADLWFHPEAVARARETLIDALRREGRLESVQFKYLLATSRKFAIPLLDYFDRDASIIRKGYTRYLRGAGS
jgi:selenocysteine-specific elongation factor